MKKSFISAAVVVYSLCFLSCLEEEAVPVPLPPPPPAAAETVDLPPPPDSIDSLDSAAAVAEIPAQDIIDTATKASTVPAPEAKPATAEKQVAAPTTVPVAATSQPTVPASEVGQSNSGKYTIQISTSPTEKAAQNVIKKLAENKISAYYARVSNPATLQGTFYRVRVGYFKGKSIAEEFASTRLAPLGYKWWVDMTGNDQVGVPANKSKQDTAKVAPATTTTPTTATVAPAKTSTSQEDAAKKAALEAAKADYQAIANKTPPPPPAPAPAKTEEKAASKAVEVNGGQVKIK